MKSAVITSGDHWITIDGIDYLRGTIETIERLTYNDGKQAVKISGSSVNESVILVDGTTINGTEVSSQQELVDFIKEHSFLDNGGDSGNGAVEWSNVQNKPLHTIDTPIEDAEGMVAVYTQGGQLPVGNPQFPENAVPLYLVEFLVSQGATGVNVVSSEYIIFDKTGYYTYTGDDNVTSALPANEEATGRRYVILNTTGTGALKITGDIYEAGMLVQEFDIMPGENYIIYNNGLHWTIL